MSDMERELYEALEALLDIAPFSSDKYTKEIHVKAANALMRYRIESLKPNDAPE